MTLSLLSVHAGQLGALAEVRERNLELWRKAGKPVMASFCASCKHSLDSYTAVLSAEEGKEWKQKCVGLSSLFVEPQISATGKAPAVVGYHQPCHWGTADPDLPLLTAGLAGLKKGTGLCCGMAQVSASDKEGSIEISVPQPGDVRLFRVTLFPFEDHEHTGLIGALKCMTVCRKNRIARRIVRHIRATVCPVVF